MFNDFEVTPSRHRVMALENGNELNLTSTDPYGFIKLSLKHGQLPPSIKDAVYTDWYTAEIAAKKYIAQRQEVEAELRIKDPAPKKG